MNLLITGGAGFIGSTFVRMALAKGHSVTVLDRLTYAGHRENLEELLLSGAVRLVVGSIADANVVSSLLLGTTRWDAVVNFAAESHVDRSISGPSPFIETNILGTFQLLEASLKYWRTLEPEARSRFRYLQVSTDEVYGELGPTGKFSEKTPYQPNSPYSASKAAADHLVRAWHHTYGLPVLTTNCSNNYGPRQLPEKLIPLMIANAVAGKPLPVYGTGLNVRDWIHVADHCAGILLALERGTPGDTYCFGGNAERTNLDVVHGLCDTLDRLKPRATGSYRDLIAFVTDRPGHDFRYAIDDTLACEKLGFTRSYDFTRGLRNTIEWYLDNQLWVHTILEKTKLLRETEKLRSFYQTTGVPGVQGVQA